MKEVKEVKTTTLASLPLAAVLVCDSLAAHDTQPSDVLPGAVRAATDDDAMWAKSAWAAARTTWNWQQQS